MTTLTPSQLFAPTPLDQFLRDYAFKQPLLVQGPNDKFSHFFNWESLNGILSYSRHDPLRVHLDRVGTGQGELEFAHTITNVRGERLPRIDVARLYQHLEEGATLVVDAVNEVDPAVAHLSEELAALLTVPRTTAVLFASFGHTPGFGVHWDNRDVYALQVEGQKHWRIHHPSRVAPLDGGNSSVPGSGEPGPLFWEGVLQAGDMLYVPRGWWHEVTTKDAPSLHLNVGFAPLTALDLLTWLTERLKGSDVIRLDIPRFSGSEALREYERAVKQEVADLLDAISMADFLAAIRTNASPQTHVSLPFGVAGAIGKPGVEPKVRLTNRMSSIAVQGDVTYLRAGGRQIEVRHGAAPILDALLGCDAICVDELAELVPEMSADDVQNLVATFVSEGVAHIVW